MTELNCAGSRRFHSRQQPDQCRFARAVVAHQRHAVAALNREIHIFENLLGLVALGQIVHGDHSPTRRRRLREGEVDDRLFFRNLDALDLFEFLDTRLHLLGFGRLRAEAIDERLEMLDLFALILVGRDQLRLAILFLLQVLGVVAGVDLQALVPDLDGPIDSYIQKIPVVRDEDVTEGVGAQVVFQPITGF